MEHVTKEIAERLTREITMISKVLVLIAEHKGVDKTKLVDAGLDSDLAVKWIAEEDYKAQHSHWVS